MIFMSCSNVKNARVYFHEKRLIFNFQLTNKNSPNEETVFKPEFQQLFLLTEQTFSTKSGTILRKLLAQKFGCLSHISQ